MVTSPTPRVSVLTAVRNGIDYLDPAMASICNQSFHDWHWVIVNDGSVDGTGDRLDEWARRDARIEVHHRPAAGIVAALNEGLDRCRAPIIARMDADDVAAPERLACQVETLTATPELTVVDSRVRLIDGARNDGMHAYVDWVNGHLDHASIAEDLFVESPIVNPAACIRRDALVAARGYRAGDFPEDYDLWLRLLRAGARFRKHPGVLLDWRDHPARLTRRDDRYRKAAFTALKQAHLWEHEGEQLRGARLALWGAGRGTRAWRQWLRGHEVAPAFVIDAHPRRIGTRILEAPVVDPSVLREKEWTYLLVTVSSPTSRAWIREQLARWQLDQRSGTHIRFV